jgi:KDO2-lipid IV(A) lauroyltransferase
MGNFILGFLKLCEFVPKGSRVTIIKWREWTRKEEAAYRNFKNSGIDLHVLRLGEKPGLAALRELRSGGIIFTLCDLPLRGLRTAPVEFFDTKALFPRGPAELALSCRGMILPLYTACEPGQKPFIRIEEPIHSTPVLEKKNREAAAGRITQQLASRIESWIKQYPGQWHFWPILELIWQTN